MSYHDRLCKIEVTKLKRKGYKVFTEYKLGHAVIDVIGFRDNYVVIIECGWLSNLSKIKAAINGARIIHVPSLKCFLPTGIYDPMEGFRYRKYKPA